MDEFDRASELEMRQRDEALARHRARLAPVPGIEGATAALDCVSCGEEIPAARRAAIPGTMYCVECQKFIEKKQRITP